MNTLGKFAPALVVIFLASSVLASPAHKPAAKPEVLPFIHDDYARALAEARSRQLPILVNASAPWCHTCVSMEAFVLTDPALAPQAGKFIWLELNSELARNAGQVARLKVDALPTFFILNPADEGVALRWVGGATVKQFEEILDHGALAVSAGKKEGEPAPVAAADEALHRADVAYSKADNAAAAAAFAEAIARAPEAWDSYGRAVESRLYALQMLDSTEAQIRLATEALPRLQHTSSQASLGSSGLAAAISLPETDSRRAELIKLFEATCSQALHDRSLQLAGDDRAALYDVLVSAREDRKDSLAARSLRDEWAAFLVGEINHASTPEQRASFDPHVLGLYLAMGHPELAVPFLQRSEKEFPADYNPPARLAVAFKAMQDWKSALAASDRAMSIAYGPRKVGFYQTRADIYLGMGSTERARNTLEQAIQFAEALPDGQRSASRIAALKKKLAGLQQPTGSAR